MTDELHELQLYKHHGLGNDFLIALGDNAVAIGSSDGADVARVVCDRRRGAGADGLMVVDGPATDGSWTMTLFNADGSRAEISGNGIRCVAQAIARQLGVESITAEAPLIIHTGAGVRELTLTPTDDVDVVDVRVEMGLVGSAAVPPNWAATQCHPDRPVAHLSLGNPHSVVAVDEVDVVDLADLGGRVPEINLEIVEPGTQPDEIRMRVHERGAGITEACGTGACASAFAARQWGLVPASADSVAVHMDGGSVRVELVDDADGTRAVLTGPAAYVATVTFGQRVLTEASTN